MKEKETLGDIIGRIGRLLVLTFTGIMMKKK